MDTARRHTAFVGDRAVGSGTLAEILPELKARFDRDRGALLLVFDEETGKQLDFDLRGSLDDIVARLAGPGAQTGPGRPRLGVVSREITLLPRHWEWLEMQPKGISATLRRLVEEAQAGESPTARRERARHAASRFLTAMAGDRPGYEEACRALYRGDDTTFEALIAAWPPDIRECALRIARGHERRA